MMKPARKPQTSAAPKVKRKAREEQNQEARDRKRDKKRRGHAAGSRANPVTQQNNKGNAAQAKDPRIGSKKPVPLLKEGTVVATPVKKAPVQQKPLMSPEDELAMLENDERLDTLLDRLENNDMLSAEEQAWLDQTLDRIDVLMEQLGIEMDDEADEDADEDMYRLLKGER
ncbi:Der GTPase-activating protein YihI [Mixta intestinalis]|jgi:ribosome assembly protein YihI (activator of Der GTPase)|uniref:Der GTPase-activating protein YihI n=1 Tax=Mixta intestinalis TaxID=1615494 RepID=A0A6P1Q4Y7_9GAMM|nr:Der GTPase-activating protein YihI [Mixta intestinalis]QHM73099.1 Der GTPase-activating protein YihI [Mixta intestinalis]